MDDLFLTLARTDMQFLNGTFESTLAPQPKMPRHAPGQVGVHGIEGRRRSDGRLKWRQRQGKKLLQGVGASNWGNGP